MGFLCFTFFIVLGSLSSPWADADGVHARGITPKLPKADNVTPQCTWWYDYGVEGPYQDMLEDSDISLQQFQQWNGVSGEERIVGRAYCVEAPTDAKPATTPSKPVSSGESCWSIAQKNGIDLNDFFTWNPIVGRDCSGLWAGYHFCIGVSGPSQFQ
ncbi:hypothetical protein G6O67_007456 [Ophiocordyceps sinensis]|uniref:LysM domain-containing protein n=1 Tax=Ophiocordyceps sinensis TaxID=72228 RepID=A0A8H4LU77_9HYPO|nr:hypothetical protein G6O67_007456 [Ophiocordyceps sinensis]